MTLGVETRRRQRIEIEAEREAGGTVSSSALCL
jgi:hypothetical protein